MKTVSCDCIPSHDLVLTSNCVIRNSGNTACEAAWLCAEVVCLMAGGVADVPMLKGRGTDQEQCYSLCLLQGNVVVFPALAAGQQGIMIRQKSQTLLQIQSGMVGAGGDRRQSTWVLSKVPEAGSCSTHAASQHRLRHLTSPRGKGCSGRGLAGPQDQATQLASIPPAGCQQAGTPHKSIRPLLCKMLKAD